MSEDRSQGRSRAKLKGLRKELPEGYSLDFYAYRNVYQLFAPDGFIAAERSPYTVVKWRNPASVFASIARWDARKARGSSS